MTVVRRASSPSKFLPSARWHSCSLSSRSCRTSDSIQTEKPLLDEYRNALTEYMKDPKCENPGFVSQSRELHALSPRAEKSSTRAVQGLLLALIVQVGTTALYEQRDIIWNSAMESYVYLQFPELRDYIKSTDAYRSQGPIQISANIICSPNNWNSLASKAHKTKLNCAGGIICEGDHCDLSNLKARAESLFRPHKHSHHNHLHKANHDMSNFKKTLRRIPGLCN